MSKVRWRLASVTALICAGVLYFSLSSVGTIAAEDQGSKASDAAPDKASQADDDASTEEASPSERKAAGKKSQKPRKEVAPKKKSAKTSRQPPQNRGSAGSRSGNHGGSAPLNAGTGSSPNSGNSNKGASGNTASHEESSGTSSNSSGNGSNQGNGKGSKVAANQQPTMPGEAPLPKEVQKVMDIQLKHTPDLLNQKGVTGTATGLNANGDVVVKVYTNGADKPVIPSKLDGIPVEVEQHPTFEVLDGFAGSPRYNPKLRADRPVAIGVSASPIDPTCAPSGSCYSGTLGCRLKAKDGSGYFALSNNHVFAQNNQKTPGTRIMQPSSGELQILCQCIDANEIGTLFAFKSIDFSLDFNQPNRIDAAIMKTTTDYVSRSTLPDGYGTPRKYTIKVPQLGMNVMKYGRTSGFTKGRIVALNSFIPVSSPDGVALYAGQITVRGVGGTFAAPGDSGSLVVDGDRFPLGLLFAGGGQIVHLNPIQEVLDEFGMEIDGDDSLDFPVPGKVGRAQPDSP